VGGLFDVALAQVWFGGQLMNRAKKPLPRLFAGFSVVGKLDIACEQLELLLQGGNRRRSTRTHQLGSSRPCVVTRKKKK